MYTDLLFILFVSFHFHLLSEYMLQKDMKKRYKTACISNTMSRSMAALTDINVHNIRHETWENTQGRHRSTLKHLQWSMGAQTTNGLLQTYYPQGPSYALNLQSSTAVAHCQWDATHQTELNKTEPPIWASVSSIERALRLVERKKQASNYQGATHFVLISQHNNTPSLPQHVFQCEA